MLAALFISVGENPCFCKRWVKQYPASLSGEFQSPTEINAQLHNAQQEHCYVCIGTRGCAGIQLRRCQLALTRIPRQFSRARIEDKEKKLPKNYIHAPWRHSGAMYVQAEYRGIPENLYKRGIPENLYKPRSPGEFVKTEVFLKICA